jgi:hypothetical protein
MKAPIFFSILVYVKKPVGFFFRRITTNGRDSPPLRKAAVRLKDAFSRTAGYPSSFVAKGSQ